MDPSECYENAFHTGSKYEVVSVQCRFVVPKFLLNVFVLLSGVPLSVVVSDTVGVELFFLVRTVSGSGAPGRLCVTLPPSPFTLGDILSRDNSKTLNFFF
jgi:hypothetical protein